MQQQKPLNIWLLQDGEQLPLVEGCKKMRTWLLGEELSKRGHQVTWWSSNFFHSGKKKVCDGDRNYQIQKNFVLKFFDCGEYKKNLSLRRIVHHYRLGKKFKEEAKKLSKPDIIVASHPIIEFSYEATKYGKENSVPVVVDVRDMWPDIFQDYFPSPMKKIIHLMIQPLKKKTLKAFNGSSAIVSMSPDLLKWSQNYTRFSTEKVKVFFIGAEEPTTKNIETKKIKEIEEEMRGKTVFLSISSFGKSYDLETICLAAKALQHRKDIFFILGGDGEKMNIIKKMSHNVNNMKLVGWLNKEEMKDLMQLAHICVVPFSGNAIPNKFGEYLSFGKPVLSCSSGYIEKLIAENKIGFSYKANDVKSFLENIDKILKDGLYKELRSNVKGLFKKSFMASVVYKEYADFVERVANE